MCSLFQVFSLSQCKVLTLPPLPYKPLFLKTGLSFVTEALLILKNLVILQKLIVIILSKNTLPEKTSSTDDTHERYDVIATLSFIGKRNPGGLKITYLFLHVGFPLLCL